MSILDIIWVLHQELIDDHLHLNQLGPHNIDLDGTLVAFAQNRRLQLDLICEDVILDYAQILGYRAQKEENYWV